MKRMPFLVYVGVLAGLLGGCRGDAPTDEPSGSGETVGALAGVGGGSVIRATLSGGPLPGTHEKRHETTTCTVGWAETGAWGNAASDTEDKEGLVGVDLIVKDPAKAKAGTDDFLAIVYINDRLDPKNQLTIEPRKGKGRGTVRIDDRGSTATVTIQGTSEAGVGVDATIDCAQILRA